MASHDVRQRVLFGLAKRDKADLAETMRAVTWASAVVLDVERVGIWRLLEDRSALVCEALYDHGQHRVEDRPVLFAAGHPAYFAALCGDRALTIDDARRDDRTADLTESYLEPLGITSLMDVPIWHQGQLYGVLCNEHVGPGRAWSPEDVGFATNLADLVSLALEASERRAAEQRWNTVLDEIAEGVFVLGAKGAVERMNPAMHALLESLEKGTLDELDELLDVHGHPMPEGQSPWKRVLRGEAVDKEIVGVQSPKGPRYYRLTLRRLGGDGDPTYVGVVSDISEEVRFEQVKRDFLGALAHELKTPVAIAKGYAQLLARTGALPADQLKKLATIERASERMDTLIRDLVDVSSILLGRLAITCAPTDLSALVAKCADAVAKREHVEIVRQVPDGISTVADAARLTNAVRQILDNAARFSPPGGRIDVSLARLDDGRARLTVRDHGVGIDPDQVRRVFDPFYRAHVGTAVDSGGLGLGLFLAREIVRAHGGEVTLASRVGEGTTVTLTLPPEDAP